jgi:hypothetical protein
MPWARGGFWPAIPMGSSVAIDAFDTGHTLAGADKIDG